MTSSDEKKSRLSVLARNLAHSNYDMLQAVALDAKFKAERPAQYDNAKGQWRDWSSGVCPTFWAQIQILTREYHEQNMLVLLWCRQELEC